jgi:hypothetical protein
MKRRDGKEIERCAAKRQSVPCFELAFARSVQEAA